MLQQGELKKITSVLHAMNKISRSYVPDHFNQQPPMNLRLDVCAFHFVKNLITEANLRSLNQIRCDTLLKNMEHEGRRKQYGK